MKRATAVMVNVTNVERERNIMEEVLNLQSGWHLGRHQSTLAYSRVF